MLNQTEILHPGLFTFQENLQTNLTVTERKVCKLPLATGILPVVQISVKSGDKIRPEVGQNEDGEGNGDEGYAVPDNLHHSG